MNFEDDKKMVEKLVVFMLDLNCGVFLQYNGAYNQNNIIYELYNIVYINSNINIL